MIVQRELQEIGLPANEISVGLGYSNLHRTFSNNSDYYWHYNSDFYGYNCNYKSSSSGFTFLLFVSWPDASLSLALQPWPYVCIHIHSFFATICGISIVALPPSFFIYLSFSLSSFAAFFFFWAQFKIYSQQTRNLVLALTAQLSSATLPLVLLHLLLHSLFSSPSSTRL